MIQGSETQAETESYGKVDWGRLGFVTLSKARYEAFEEIQAGITKSRLIFPTGFKTLDRQLMGGFAPKKLYIIGGRPSSGKSMFVNELIFRVLNAAKADKKKIVCLYFTFEMDGKSQVLRYITKEMSIGLDKLLSIDESLEQNIFAKAIEKTKRLDGLPIFFKQTSTTITDAFKIVDQVYKSLPDHIILNVWDHSRLFVPDNMNDSEVQRLTVLSQGLVRMQQNTGCINILLSQLNRNIETPARAINGYVPMLSDLFGSDSVGQDADLVMIINRPHDMYGYTGKYCGVDPFKLFAVHVEKNRLGPTGMIPFDCDMSTFAIDERKKNPTTP